MDPDGKVIEVYLHSSQSVTLPGARSISIFDAEIASAEMESPNIVRFEGLARGETVAVVTFDDKIASFLVQVIPRPEVPPPPSFQPDPERGYGFVASDAQISRTENQKDLALLSNVAWTQKDADHLFDAALWIEDHTLTGQKAFNPRNAWIDYLTPRFEVNILDFNQDLTGQLQQSRLSSYSVSNFVQLRGFRMAFIRGRNRYTVYGGTTLPSYFLIAAGSRDVAGFAFHHQQTEKLSWSTTSSWVNVPEQNRGGTRTTSFMHMGAFSYIPSERWNFDGAAGVSNHGTLFRGNAGYWGEGWSGYLSFLQSSPEFPLNQIQSLFAGTTSVRAGASFGWNSHLGKDIYYEHTITNSGILSVPRAVSDYLSPALSYRFSQTESANISYTYSRNTGGFNIGAETGNRLDIALNSGLSHNLRNTAHFKMGLVEDPLGLQSQHELQFDDNLSLPIRTSTLYLGYSWNRLDPSLIRKLQQEFGLLSPQLAQLFAQNPEGVAIADLPPEIRALVEAQIPVSSAITASLQTHLGRRITVSPNLSFTHSTSGPQSETWQRFIGYSLNYQLSRSIILRSSLSSVWTTNSALTAPLRSTLFTIGLQKSFNGSLVPLSLLHGASTISGRVFRDGNFNGAYESGEGGFEGIPVQLDSGAVERTDRNGYFHFTGVRGDIHQVSIDTTQFSTPIRMTTAAELEVNLIGRRTGFADFGAVDFARLTGNVFNDLYFDGRREASSVPVGDVQLLLTDNDKVRRTIAVSAGGSFELDNMDPGDYELAVDPATLPANYSAPSRKVPVHLAPVSTAAIDIPLRAMRSVSGHVYVKTPGDRSGSNGNAPLAGVQLTAGYGIVKTDSDGAFVLRNLPAGDLTVQLIFLKEPPPGAQIPSGHIHMPPEPVSIEGASIVIMNAALVPSLTDLTDQPGK